MWSRFASALSSGAWLTPKRAKAYALLLLVGYGAAIVGVVATRSGPLDGMGRPIGADFGMMWTSGRLALEGRAAEIWSLPVAQAAQAAAFGPGAGLTPWHYPPLFLLVAAPLAALPYLAALTLWQGAGFALYLAGVRALLPGRPFALLLAAASPAVFVNLGHGQTGLLVAGLWSLALAALTRAPVLAGLAFGCLALKPQLAWLAPIALLAGWRLRALLWAAVAAGALALVSTLAFGLDVWRAFLASLDETRRLTLELGATGFEKIQSPYAALRLLGAPMDIAMAAQIALALAVAASVVFIWRSSADMRLKQATLLAGAMVATPYSLDYDLTLAAPAILLAGAVAIERGLRPYEASFATLVFVTPILARLVAGATGVPIGAPVLLVFWAWLVRLAVADARLRTSPAPPHPSAHSPRAP